MHGGGVEDEGREELCVCFLVSVTLLRVPLCHYLPPSPPAHAALHTQIKAWLMENGPEEEVWQLAQKKGKKADYEALMRRVMGGGQ